MLTHTVGFSYDFANETLARYLAQTGSPSAASGLKAGLRQPLMFEPGARWEYVIGIDWAGQAVEAVSGMTLDKYFEVNIAAPLGMRHTLFAPRADQQARCAAMHQRKPDGGLMVIPFEPRPAPEFLAGDAGLVSTALDYLRFLRLILNQSGSLLTPETMAAMGINQISELRAGKIGLVNPALTAEADFYPGPDAKWGLGFPINPQRGMFGKRGMFGRSPNSLVWAGLPSCYYRIDIANRSAPLS